MDGMSVSLFFAAAVADFQAGKTGDAFTDLSMALGKVQPLMQDCQHVSDEVAVLVKDLKDLSPASLESNIAAHRTDILDAFAAAASAKDAEDYSTMGYQLGLAARKVISADALVAGSHNQKLVAGLLKGLLSDADNIDSCQTDATTTGTLVMAAVEDVKAGKFMDAVSKVQKSVAQLQPLADECRPIADELSALMTDVLHFSPEKAKTNFVAHEKEIMDAFAEAAKARAAGDFDTLGYQIGLVARNVLLADAVVV